MVFLLGSHLTSSIFYLYHEGVHWNIGGKLRNPVFGNILNIYFNKELMLASD